ncbi:MAG: hypothetical protein M3Q58_11525 [Bacteroidota bacterium]|nr:hypothetical protein [Bacteroidota bacterium]
MKNKTIIIPAVLLVISLATYTTVISNGSVRTVDFLAIVGIGALAGVLLTQVFTRSKKQKSL